MLRDEVTRAIDKGHNYDNSAVTLVTGKCKARHVVCDHPCSYPAHNSFSIEDIQLKFHMWVENREWK